jgi:hypothetical protein
MSISEEKEKLILKQIWKHKHTQQQKHKETCWRYHNTRLQIILWRHSNRNNNNTTVKEKNRRHRNKHTEQRDIWFLTKDPRTYNAEKIVSSTNRTGNTRYLHAEGSNSTVLTQPIQNSFKTD